MFIIRLLDGAELKPPPLRGTPVLIPALADEERRSTTGRREKAALQAQIPVHFANDTNIVAVFSGSVQQVARVHKAAAVAFAEKSVSSRERQLPARQNASYYSHPDRIDVC
jgi:hypothetical protein